LQHGVAARWFFGLAPFLLGAVVAGVVYVLLARHNDDEATHDANVVADVDADFDAPPPRRRATGARSILVWILGASAGIGALIAGMFSAMGGDGGPPSSTADMVAGAFSGGIQGAIIGAVLGSLLAIPAAVVVWMLRRGRR
jgi:hypothetical protein